MGAIPGPGTIYPLLAGLKKDGFLRSERQVVKGNVRKYYRATWEGKRALEEAFAKARELVDELDGDQREDLK